MNGSGIATRLFRGKSSFRKKYDEPENGHMASNKFVPGFNSEQIEAMASFMSGVKNLTKVRILPYHNYAGNKYKSLGMRDTLPETMPDEKDIEEAMIFLKTYGIVVM